MAENTDSAPPEDTQAMTQLHVGDIEAAVKVIDYACDQGAFKGWATINDVMTVRNRLVGFLRVVTPVQIAAEPSTEGQG